VKKIVHILGLVRLRPLLASGGLGNLSIDGAESSALSAVVDALHGNDEEKQESMIKNFLQGLEDFDGISCMSWSLHSPLLHTHHFNC
jgi:hypothetical protein